ncbi:MAG TPA: MarR family transcriptional regulator [Rhodospirillaceae bacterium]|nr:MAG: hypothetical protein A2018_07615 [Alphaproteobacteria bacterium GWF2_58_20]HAU29166.1 MarR family transcriptional regulator [Rhodospirillaceae bacterium]
MQDLLGRYIGFVLSDVARLLKHDFDRYAADLGVTRAQFRVLVCLWFQDGVRQKELADILEISPMTLARLLDRLETWKWVERRPDPGDRRVRRVHLVGDHPELRGKMLFFAENIQAKVFGGISETEKENMFDVLQRMRANLGNPGLMPDSMCGARLSA